MSPPTKLAFVSTVPIEFFMVKVGIFLSKWFDMTKGHSKLPLGDGFSKFLAR
jgi:hypothetical protein